MPDISIQVGLALREDFSVKISREKVKEMHEVVERELGYIMEGCVSTVTGGYVPDTSRLWTMMADDGMSALQIPTR